MHYTLFLLFINKNLKINTILKIVLNDIFLVVLIQILKINI